MGKTPFYPSSAADGPAEISPMRAALQSHEEARRKGRAGSNSAASAGPTTALPIIFLPKK